MPGILGSAIVPFSILICTLALVLWRPRGLPEGAAAGLGAAATLLLGFSSAQDVLSAAHDTAGILVFLVAIMVLAALAEAAGVFRWLASATLLTARGRGWLLYVNLYVLGAAVTLFLSLDVTAVILTPLVCALVLPLRLDARPFVFASAFVANTASLALPVSNLTNMLVYELLGVPFWDFVRYLAIPNLVGLAVNLSLLISLFWRRLPGRLRIDPPSEHPAYYIPRTAFFQLSAATLAVTIALLLVAGIVDRPFWPVALGAAVLLASAALIRRWVTATAVAQSVSWGLPPFVVGMSVVVGAVYRAAAPALSALVDTLAALPGPLPLFGAVAIAAIGANAVNNLPFSLGAIELLRIVPSDAVTAAGAPLRDTLSFGTLLGVNLGPCVTVTGSLATMLCLSIARRHGVHISGLDFLRVGAVITAPTLLAATITTALFLR